MVALLSGLGDRDTIVRWSAAKGVGRLAAKLQAAFADQLLDSILERNLSDVATGEDAWHGGCLAIAELARRELIESSRVDDLVPVVRGGLDVRCQAGIHECGDECSRRGCLCVLGAGKDAVHGTRWPARCRPSRQS